MRASFGTSLSSLNFRNAALDTKIGIDKHIPFEKKWSFYFGAEAHLRGATSEFGNTGTLGISGLAGVTFKPVNNISLFTEFGIGPGLTWTNVDFSGNTPSSGFTLLGDFQLGVLIDIGK